MTGFHSTVWPSAKVALNSCLVMPMKVHQTVCSPGLSVRVYWPSTSVATVVTLSVK